MKIIQTAPNPSGAYPAPHTWNNSTLPDGYAVFPNEFEAEFTHYGGFVIPTFEDVATPINGDAQNLRIALTLTAIEPNIEAWEAWKAWKAEQEPEDKEAQYKSLVQQYIHSGIPGSEPLVFYTIDDELALANEDNAAIRNNEESSQKYLDYRAYVDECKKRARQEIYGEQTPDEGV